jgi:competence protein ComEC
MRNPRDFDAAQYLAERGLDGRMAAHLVTPTDAPAPEPRLARWRQALGLRLERALPLGEGDRARLLGSLVLGIRGAGLPEETTEQYRRAGTIHLMVVSGSQVTMLVLLFTMPLAFARRRGGPTSYPRWRVALLFLGLPLLWLYVMLADTGPSIDRALIMALLSVLAMLLGLSPWARARSFQPDMLTLWAAAAGLMLVGNPALLFSPGAQLSFGAVLGLLTVGRPITRLLQHRMPAFLALILGATLGAQLMLYPILAWHFGRLPLLAPLTNLVAVPIAALLLPLGLLTAVCALVWPPASQGFGMLALWLLRALDGTCALAARVPWAEVGWYVNTPGPVLLYYALLTGGALLLSRWADRLATDWRVPAGSEPDLW